MFAKIENLKDLLAHVENKHEIRINEHDNGYTVACYMIADENTFDDTFALECRGITFDEEGYIAARPLTKFFNMGERESTRKENLDWTKVVRVMDKRDGSMLHPVLVDGKVKMKSKKSFTSDIAVMCDNFIKNNPEYEDFCLNMLTAGYTPIFEFTTPKMRIVLPYKDEELVLLHIRNNATGEYMMPKVLEGQGRAWGIPVVENVLTDDFNIDELLKYVETAEGIEGFVVQFENGDMVKIKTPWYLALHRTVTFTRERDVAKMVIDETLDDYKSYLTEMGISHRRVEEIEHRVVTMINEVQDEVEAEVEKHKGREFKDVAQDLKGHKYFGQIMRLLRGQEIDFVEYFEKNLLKENFSLEQLDDENIGIVDGL